MFLDILIKTIIIYFLCFLVLKFMGKREIGQLSLFDLVVLLIITDISVIGLEEDFDKFLIYLCPIVLLALIQKVLAFALLKFPKARGFFDGKESLIIVNGKLNIKEMRRLGYNVDDLLVQLRLKNISSLSEVKYVILETNGEISVFKYDNDDNMENVKTKSKSFNSLSGSSGSETILPKNNTKQLYPFPLIVSGEIKKDNLKLLNLSRKWLIEEVKKQGYEDYHKIMYASYEDKKLFIIDTCNF